jgi:glycosyltransferase involved in cell wall biosynthesis
MSIVNQTVLPEEIIIINDGSTDESLIKLNKLKLNCSYPNIRIINQTNQGVSSARNKGIYNSKTDYVAFLDADDEWSVLFIEKTVEMIKKYPDAVLYTFKHQIRENNKYYIPFQNFGKNEEGYISDFFVQSLKSSLVNSSKVVIKKDILSNIGGFPENAVITEDLYVWSRLALLGEFVFNKYLAVTINKEVDNSRSNRRNKLPYIIDFYSKNKSMITSDLNKYLYSIHFNHLLNSKLHKNNNEFFLRWKQGLNIYPIRSIYLLLILFIPSNLFSIFRELKHKIRSKSSNKSSHKC